MDDSNATSMNHAMLSRSILMPLPDLDFDPTESAIPWKECSSRGWSVAFSTEYGNVAQGELHMLKGPLPGLLSAGEKAQIAYREMTQDQEYQHPIPYAEINPEEFDALLLPGGDTLRMRQYLESSVLREKVLQLWQRETLIGAICHGVLVLARTIDPQTRHSILYGHKVTALPKSLDRTAYLLDSLLMKRGYLIYASCVAEEVCAALEHREDFVNGPSILTPFAVSDGNLITSRWYLDAELFSKCFADTLEQRM